MTSTRFNVGLGDDTRSSSRVLRPPGGTTTDIFGGDPEPPRGRRLNPAAASATSLGQYAQQANGQPQNGAPEPAAPAQTPEEPPQAAPEPEPAPAPASAPAPEPQKPVEPKAAPPAPEAPKRVRVPPGGFSSGLW